jgi:small subunit ribosomal protein S1
MPSSTRSERNFYMDQPEETIGEEMLPGSESDEQEEHPMDALLDAEAYELETPRRGEIRKGTIARVTDSDILVDVGAKSEGIIQSRELEQMSPEEREELTVGKEVNVYVVRSLDRDGTVLLSISRAEEEQDWVDVEELHQSQEVYESTVSGYNKGGLIVKVGHLRGFVPASQVSASRRRRADGSSPDQRWGKMVDEPIVVKVIEVDRRRNRLILSERAAAREAREVMKERLIEEIEVGETREGQVISLADFGAFVDIGGADGLIHMSELSWKRISHPSEVVQVGEDVQVKILNVDPERKRISLSLRELEDDPWDEIAQQYQEGQLVEGTISKLTKFGAFAYLKGTEEYDIEGLIHISELSDRRVEHPREVVEEGQTLTLRMINIDQERRRIGLSLKRVDSSEYTDLDWQSAMEELEAEAEEVIAVEDAMAEVVEGGEVPEPAAERPSVEADEVAVEDVPEAEESVVTEEPEAEESVVTEEPEVEEPVVAEEPEAEESVVSEEPEAEESVVTEDPEAEEPVVAEEPEAEESVVAEDPEAEEPAVEEEPVVMEEEPPVAEPTAEEVAQEEEASAEMSEIAEAELEDPSAQSDEEPTEDEDTSD